MRSVSEAECAQSLQLAPQIAHPAQEALATAGRLPLLDRLEDSRIFAQGAPDHRRTPLRVLEGVFFALFFSE